MHNKLKTEEKWLVFSIPLLFIAGTLLHFLYDFTGKCVITGIFAPVNESIWEHTKMVILPTLLFYVIYYIVTGRKRLTDINKWFTSALVSILVMILTIPFVFYFYTNAFGTHLLWMDILILLIANTVGQLVSLHIYRHSNGIKWYISLAVILIIIGIYVVFTFITPQIPLFMDSETGLYGIQ